MNTSPWKRQKQKQDMSSIFNGREQQTTTAVAKGRKNPTYQYCLPVGLSRRLLQSLEERCWHLTHRLHVGEQPVYIHNLTHRTKGPPWEGHIDVVFLFNPTDNIFLLLPIFVPSLISTFPSLCWGDMHATFKKKKEETNKQTKTYIICHKLLSYSCCCLQWKYIELCLFCNQI